MVDLYTPPRIKYSKQKKTESQIIRSLNMTFSDHWEWKSASVDQLALISQHFRYFPPLQLALSKDNPQTALSTSFSLFSQVCSLHTTASPQVASPQMFLLFPSLLCLQLPSFSFRRSTNTQLCQVTILIKIRHQTL